MPCVTNTDYTRPLSTRIFSLSLSRFRSLSPLWGRGSKILTISNTINQAGIHYVYFYLFIVLLFVFFLSFCFYYSCVFLLQIFYWKHVNRKNKILEMYTIKSCVFLSKWSSLKLKHTQSAIIWSAFYIANKIFWIVPINITCAGINRWFANNTQ